MTIFDFIEIKKELIATLEGETTDAGALVTDVKYAEGTVRTRKDGDYRKQSGQWVKIYSGEGRGASLAVTHAVKKIKAAKNVDELMDLVNSNISRFYDKNGKLLPVVARLRDAVNESKTRINSAKKEKQTQERETQPSISEMMKFISNNQDKVFDEVEKRKSADSKYQELERVEKEASATKRELEKKFLKDKKEGNTSALKEDKKALKEVTENYKKASDATLSYEAELQKQIATQLMTGKPATPAETPTQEQKSRFSKRTPEERAEIARKQAENEYKEREKTRIKNVKNAVDYAKKYYGVDIPDSIITENRRSGFTVRTESKTLTRQQQEDIAKTLERMRLNGVLGGRVDRGGLGTFYAFPKKTPIPPEKKNSKLTHRVFSNGFKDKDGKLIKARYYLNDDGSIHVYADSYKEGILSFLEHGNDKVRNDSDMYTDYFDKDDIKVSKDNPYYKAIIANSFKKDASEITRAKNTAERKRAELLEKVQGKKSNVEPLKTEVQTKLDNAYDNTIARLNVLKANQYYTDFPIKKAYLSMTPEEKTKTIQTLVRREASRMFTGNGIRTEMNSAKRGFTDKQLEEFIKEKTGGRDNMAYANEIAQLSKKIIDAEKQYKVLFNNYVDKTGIDKEELKELTE